MDSLEFCIKRSSYPLGLLFEELHREPYNGMRIVVEEKRILIPEKMPFAALCYLLQIALFESRRKEDRKKLEAHMEGLELWKRRILSSKLGGALSAVLAGEGEYLEVRSEHGINWEELERRKNRLGTLAGEVQATYRRVLESGAEKSERKRMFISETCRILGALNTDEALLLVYLVGGDSQLQEFLMSALGKCNEKFHADVVTYFKRLAGH